MDKDTKERLGEIREALKKYGFDKLLGQTAKSKIKPGDDGEELHALLLDDELLDGILSFCLTRLDKSPIEPNIAFLIGFIISGGKVNCKVKNYKK